MILKTLKNFVMFYSEIDKIKLIKFLNKDTTIVRSILLLWIMRGIKKKFEKILRVLNSRYDLAKKINLKQKDLKYYSLSLLSVLLMICAKITWLEDF